MSGQGDADDAAFMRSCLRPVLIAGALATAAIVAPPTSAATPEGATATVIVIQRGSVPAAGASRRAAIERNETPLASAISSAGGRVVARLGLIDAVVARVTPAQQLALAQRPDVASVVPDRRIRVRLPSAPAARATTPTRRVYSGACPSDPAKPEIDPEALTTMSVRPRGPHPGAWQYADGAGVRVGIIAQGIDVENPDLVRADGTRVIDDYYDLTGAGTSGPVGSFETFIDAESVAAQGRQVFDLNQEGYGFIDPPGCTLRVVGVAPAASLDVVQAFDIGGYSSISELVRAVDRLVEVDHVDVLNESIGASAYPSTGADPLAMADDAAVAQGVTVIAGSGDSGIGNTLATPADDPEVLAVGGTDQLRALEQIGYAGKQGSWSDGNVANLSSGGIAQNGKTLDAVAPGFYSWISCTPTPQYPDCNQTPGGPIGLSLAGGTSESAPLVSGVAALVVQTYRCHHGGHSPSPAVVRQILTGTADDLGAPTAEQGAGQINALRAVRAAASWNATGRAQSVAPTQADLVANAGASSRATVRITNHGSAAVTDTVRIRAERAAGVHRFPFVLDQGSAGYQVNAFSVSVPPGTQRLAITGLVADPKVSTFLDVYVFDPNGVYSADAAPQGLTNTSYVDIERPRAGTWTVKTFGQSYSDPYYAGPAEVDVRYYRASAAGATVTPSRVRLAPGRSVTVRATLPAEASAVDGTAALLVTDDAGATTTVPIAIRRVVPLTGGSGSFTGVLTGGNGRTQGALEGTSLEVEPPDHSPALCVHIALPALDGLRVFALLIDPSGVAVDRESNVLDGTPQASIDLTALRPRPGRWRLTFGVDGTLPGTSDTIAYSGTVTTTPPDVSSTGLPAGAVLTAGTPVTATVRIVNDTAATHTYVVDPRTDGATVLPVAVTSPFAAPVTFDNPAPTVAVPPFTSSLRVRATSSDPVSIELQLGSAFENENFGQWNDPVVLGGTGTTPAVRAVGDPLTPGLWRVYPQPTASATASVRLRATATTAPFDPDVVSSTGDPWSGRSGAPLTLQPGQQGDVTVTITPTQARHGRLAVETYDATHVLVSVVGTIPYSYAVQP